MPAAFALERLHWQTWGTGHLSKAGHCEKSMHWCFFNQQMQAGSRPSTVRRSRGQRVVSMLAGWARRYRLVDDPSTDDTVSWCIDGRRYVPYPPTLHAKGGRAARARAGLRAPRSATHLDRERPADHLLRAGRGSFTVRQPDLTTLPWPIL